MADFDIAGGYDPERDWFMPGQHENPEMRDSASMWISDSQGRFGLPRFCIEAVAGEWDNRGVEANIAFPDGRVLIGAGGFAPAPEKIVGGKVATLSAGPLTFEIVKPQHQWQMRFDGSAYETTVQAQMAGTRTGAPRLVRIELDATTAVPPWSPGERVAQNAASSSTTSHIGAVGGHRYEQLFRCKGVFQIAGEDAIDFSGTGLVIRRNGARAMDNFPGHIWQSALFPSGKAFGAMGFPPKADGTAAFNEAYVFDGRKKRYARIVEAPWMTSFVPHGGPIDVVLETEDGQRVRISGKTYDSTCIAAGNPMFGNWTQDGIHQVVELPFHQGGAVYEWDGEQAYGMIERSYPNTDLAG